MNKPKQLRLLIGMITLAVIGAGLVAVGIVAGVPALAMSGTAVFAGGAGSMAGALSREAARR